MSSPSGVALHHRLDIGGLGITRYVLDQLLARLATQHGALIQEGTRITDVVFADDQFTLSTAAGSTCRARIAKVMQGAL